MKKELIVKTLKIFGALIILGTVCLMTISFFVKGRTKNALVSIKEAESFQPDAIMVLGAKVRDGKPSLMLADRLDTAIDIHFKTNAPLIMSGDCSGKEYNEVEVMKNYALEKGVDEDKIFTDPQGYSTFESVVRLKEEWEIEKAVIVSQEYHLPRALYIAENAELEAIGVAAKNVIYYGHAKRLIREILARNKDFLSCMFI